MKNKATNKKGFHSPISTRHVFIKEEQVFMKADSQEAFIINDTVAEWFPTDFCWDAPQPIGIPPWQGRTQK